MKAYGAELVLTEGAKGMKGAIVKANELAQEIPSSFIPGQFVNRAIRTDGMFFRISRMGTNILPMSGICNTCFRRLRIYNCLIRELDAEIEEIETTIQTIMDEMHSPITTIPGIGYRMGAMILAGVRDFSRFESSDKLLAYVGLSPSTYQSGQLKNCYSHMEKTRFSISALCHLQRHQVCLLMGPQLCGLPR